MIEINSIVPEVSLMGSDKKEHSLSEYKGKKIVLYKEGKKEKKKIQLP